jgi:hypothetical protein
MVFDFFNIDNINSIDRKVMDSITLFNISKFTPKINQVIF